MTSQKSQSIKNSFQSHKNSLLATNYSLRYRVVIAIISIIIGVCIAGFWNYQAVDGFGREFVAGNIVGDTESLSSSYNDKGMGFGFLFAMTAGLAATFTACNCVVFAMLPSLSCSTDPGSSRKQAFKILLTFITGVLVVNLIYGFFIGMMSSETVEVYNSRDFRIQQAQIIYSAIGILLLGWGLISFGFLSAITSRLSERTYFFFANPVTKATIMGGLVGLFSIGRPFPVFREFLAYAAASNNPFFSALAMSIQGVGQIAVMVLIFVILLLFFSKRLGKWMVKKPQQIQLWSACAFVAGAAYFIFYWGLAFLFDIGRWGFKLNLY